MATNEWYLSDVDYNMLIADTCALGKVLWVKEIEEFYGAAINFY
jgi:hypothetical protein